MHESPSQTVEAAALDWSSDGFVLVENEGDVPTEYLFNGGATDAVSNNRSILLNYRPLPSPLSHPHESPD